AASHQIPVRRELADAYIDAAGPAACRQGRSPIRTAYRKTGPADREQHVCGRRVPERAHVGVYYPHQTTGETVAGFGKERHANSGCDVDDSERLTSAFECWTCGHWHYQ